jgi:membrane protein insertase Oxa1/YidC/SpoIIIJ
LAFAIVILTIIIKLALLLPNHKALKNQKELQKLQPKLEEIKKKFA